MESAERKLELRSTLERRYSEGCLAWEGGGRCVDCQRRCRTHWPVFEVVERRQRHAAHGTRRRSGEVEAWAADRCRDATCSLHSHGDPADAALHTNTSFVVWQVLSADHKYVSVHPFIASRPRD